MPSDDHDAFLAFVPEHTTSGHRVLGLRVRGDGVEAETVADLPDGPSATVLADALNGVLRGQYTADRQINAVLDGTRDDVRTAVSRLLPSLRTVGDAQESLRLVAALPSPTERGPELFPTTNCPGLCETCGDCQDDCQNCEECADGGCETCLPVVITPRTAAALEQALAVLGDEVYDAAEDTEDRSSGKPSPLGAVPTCVAGQDAWFLRRYARAFDDLATDLHEGRWPAPACTAEEVALDLAIQDAERRHHDEPELVATWEARLPASRFDYDWFALQDYLFQDKDYEVLLHHPDALSDDEVEGWFGEFGNVPTRDPKRGFRR
ncbi:hypothetical protein [Amycolatopsis anabasis]|uniref:hypothetical protein n=1 Tax=Amycolatopsis anabasis TaxID=1840409 RepID=UPI00131A852D|nr:hypothetical protein [Amycolatopsis anabasis]